MVASTFDYVAVGTYDEAVSVLCELGDDAKILAGGQSLVPMLNLRLARPSALVDINPIAACEPFLDDGTIVLPAMLRHGRALSSNLVAEATPMLAAALRHVGNVRVRNRGTIGGSLAHGEATSEVCAVSLALGGRVLAQGPHGAREVPVEGLFEGFLTTVLEFDEVLTEVRLPAQRPSSGWGFHEVVRRSSDYAIVAVAASVELGESGVIESARMGIGGVADRPVLASPEVLGALCGCVPDTAPLEEVSRAVASATEPPSDVHASGAYRRRLVTVLSLRALDDALRRAGSGAGRAS